MIFKEITGRTIKNIMRAAAINPYITVKPIGFYETAFAFCLPDDWHDLLIKIAKLVIQLIGFISFILLTSQFQRVWQLFNAVVEAILTMLFRMGADRFDRMKNLERPMACILPFLQSVILDRQHVVQDLNRW